MVPSAQEAEEGIAEQVGGAEGEGFEVQGDEAEQLPQPPSQPAQEGALPPLAGFDLGGQGGQQRHPQRDTHSGQNAQLEEQGVGQDGV